MHDGNERKLLGMTVISLVKEYTMERNSNEVIKNEVRDGNIRGILRADLSAQDQIEDEILNDGNELASQPATNRAIKASPTVDLQKDSLS